MSRGPSSATTKVAATEAACGAATPEIDPPPTFNRAPGPALADNIDYSAVIHTSCGSIRMDLLKEQAPVAVNNFIYLARGGFYDGLVWHQVKDDFVIQTGDPDGHNGLPDGPGYAIPDELPKKKDPYTYGTVAMARRGGSDTGGSQFFIAVHDLAGALSGSAQSLPLPRDYTVFGRVDAGSFRVTEAIAGQRTAGGTDPVLAAVPEIPVYIEWVEIVEKPLGL